MVTFVVDSVAPTTTLVVPASVTSAFALITGVAADPAPAGAEVALVEIQIDSDTSDWITVRNLFTPVNGGQSWAFTWNAGYEDGVSHQFRARVTDNAGNVSTPTAWQSTIVDNVAPALALTSQLTDFILGDYLAGNVTASTPPILVGTLSDGGGIQSVTAVVTDPAGNEFTAPGDFDSQSWSITPAIITPLVGVYSAEVTVVDNAGNRSQIGPFSFEALNTPPVAVDDDFSTDEDSVLPISGTVNLLADNGHGADFDLDGDPLTVASVNGSTANVGISLTLSSGAIITVAADGDFTYDPNGQFETLGLSDSTVDTFSYNAFDFVEPSLNTATVSVTVSGVNDPPIFTSDPHTRTVQYSDIITPATITVFDIDADWLTFSQAGLPPGISLVDQGCDDSVRPSTCTAVITGTMQAPAGLHTATISVTDGLITPTQTITFVVSAEDTTLTFEDDNVSAVQVTAPESNASLPFEMVIYVEELEPDLAVYGAAPGDITLADVSMTLEPVGPGSPVTGLCTPILIDDTVDNYGDVLKVICAFDSVPVNTYSVNVTVDGGYYDGYGESVVVIYDPSLGFTTGGGWFYWPGTEDTAFDGYPGDKTNFGYSMQYNKNNLRQVKGSLLLIRHMPDGTIYRVKSNALDGAGLALGNLGFFGWASFTGKATYMEPGMPEPIGNHSFLAYVEDHDEPGNGIDKFWLESRDKDGLVISDLSMARPGSENRVDIQKGNIVVPHSGGTGNQPPTADFIYANDTLKVTFSDQSDDFDGNVVAWDWDFGDGNSSAEQSPTHTYAAGGDYYVTLTVTDDGGASDATSQQVTVTGPNQAPTANFSYISSGLVVTFTDTSSDPDPADSIIAWSWDFGNGNSDNVQNPVFTYTVAGTYQVLLTVTDENGASDTFGQQVTVSDGGGANEIYVDDLVGTSIDAGGTWVGVVTITVLDNAGIPVPNATVTGRWSKGFNYRSSCTTDTSGTCDVVQTGIENKTRRVTFTVENVTHPTMAYNPSLNVVSSIRVNRP
jgi:VCBS repeat-containing protein